MQPGDNSWRNHVNVSIMSITAFSFGKHLHIGTPYGLAQQAAVKCSGSGCADCNFTPPSRGCVCQKISLARGGVEKQPRLLATTPTAERQKVHMGIIRRIKQANQQCK